MPAQYPDIGFPPGSAVSLLRRICNNTALIVDGGGGGGGGLVPAPANPASPGSAGQWAIDDSYFYAYSAAAGQWLRTPMSDW
jgi:hypothetical protein